MKQIWDADEEARRLSARFASVENRAAFARANGIKGGQAMVYQHITGRRPIRLDAALAYARAFGCSLEDISPRLALETRKATALLPLANSAERANTAYSVLYAEEPKMQCNVVPIGTRQATPPGEYIRLEIYDIRVAAGPGAAEIEHPDVVSHLPVLREWALDNLGSADPKVIKLVTAAGDSMHPTIEDGALLFVDVRVRGFQGDGIYCLAWNGGMLVKRLVAMRDGSLQIVSDNPSGPSPEVVKGHDLDRIAICGRVKRVKRWWSLRKA